MTVKQAAAALGVSPRRVHQYIAEGRIKAQKLGRDVFVRKSSVEALERKPLGRPPKEG